MLLRLIVEVVTYKYESDTIREVEMPSDYMPTTYTTLKKAVKRASLERV